MGTLGSYLSSARESKGIDLHDAAQQTRIGIAFLRAMEEEDFSKLPGEVFVKGFLKSYARFLDLEEGEIMQRYQQVRSVPDAAQGKQPKQPPVRHAGSAQMQGDAVKPPAAVETAKGKGRTVPSEAVLWTLVLVAAFIAFLLVALPHREKNEVKKDQGQAATAPLGPSGAETAAQQPQAPLQLYLEIVALEDAWVLVRTDASPQKRAVLKKGESVIWSASERFLLTYGSVGSLKLALNGNELAVNAPKNAVVRDLIITAAGITVQKLQNDQAPRPPKPRTDQATGAVPAQQPVQAAQPVAKPQPPVQGPAVQTPQAGQSAVKPAATAGQAAPKPATTAPLLPSASSH